MSTSFASARGVNKNTCGKCSRTVYVVVIEGERVATDPELIAVVPKGRKERILAHRVHGELCDRYRLEADKKAFALAQRKASNPIASLTPTELRRKLMAHYTETARAKRQALGVRR